MICSLLFYTIMPLEIERKFLVANDDYRQLANPVIYRQGYISSGTEATVRVRTAGNRGFLTLKGKTTGAARSEFEYEIPFAEAQELLDTLCRKPLIEKQRYKILFEGFLWEVDEFFGENQGLVIAEIELPSETAIFARPPWIGEEVTGNPRYYNASMVDFPYCKW